MSTNYRPELSSYEGFGVFGEPGYRSSFKMYKKLTVQAMTMFGDHRRSDLQEVAYRAIDMLMTDLKGVGGQVCEFCMLLAYKRIRPKVAKYNISFLI